MENEHGIANIVVVNNVVQNPMTSTPTPGKIQTLKIKVRVYVIFLQRILNIFVFKKNEEFTYIQNSNSSLKMME